jgi:nicotinamidase-related amidase
MVTTTTQAMAPRRGRRDRDHLLRVWGIDTLVICGTLANICVHYTATSAARWYDVVIPRDAVSALEPFDLESSLRQTAFVFAGRITTAAGVRLGGMSGRRIQRAR